MNLTHVKQELMNNRYNKQKMQDMKQELIIEKMKMDKTISLFLKNTHHYGMMQEDTNTPKWKDFKTLRKEYTELDSLVKLASYYSGN